MQTQTGEFSSASSLSATSSAELAAPSANSPPSLLFVLPGSRLAAFRRPWSNTRSAVPGKARTHRCVQPPLAGSFPHRTRRKQAPPHPRTSCVLLFRFTRRLPDFSQFFARCKQARSHRSHGYFQDLGQFCVGLPLNFPQPDQCSLLFWQASEGVGDERNSFCLAFGGFIPNRSVPRFLLSPPICSALSSRSEKIRAQRSPLWLKPIGTSPNLRE